MYYNQLLKLLNQLPKGSYEYKECKCYVDYYYCALGNYRFKNECKQFLEKHLTK